MISSEAVSTFNSKGFLTSRACEKFNRFDHAWSHDLLTFLFFSQSKSLLWFRVLGLTIVDYELMWSLLIVTKKLKWQQDEKYGLVTTQTEARHSPVLSNFVDVDLPDVSGKKCMAIRRSKLLLGRVAGDESDIRVSRTDLHGNDYHVIAADFTDTASLEAKLTTDCALVSTKRGCKTSRATRCLSASTSEPLVKWKESSTVASWSQERCISVKTCRPVHSDQMSSNFFRNNYLLKVLFWIDLMNDIWDLSFYSSNRSLLKNFTTLNMIQSFKNKSALGIHIHEVFNKNC